MSDYDADTAAEQAKDERDEALAAAVKAWCDAEIEADSDYSTATLIGEWCLVVSRSGFDADGEPVSQILDTGDGSATRRLGLIRVIQLQLERYLLS